MTRALLAVVLLLAAPKQTTQPADVLGPRSLTIRGNVGDTEFEWAPPDPCCVACFKCGKVWHATPTKGPDMMGPRCYHLLGRHIKELERQLGAAELEITRLQEELARVTGITRK